MSARSKSEKSGAVELHCPCCKERLIYDPLEESLRAAVPGKGSGKQLSLDAAVSALQADREKVDERFRQAMEREDRRRESLGKKFEDSLRQKGRNSDPLVRPIDLD